MARIHRAVSSGTERRVETRPMFIGHWREREPTRRSAAAVPAPECVHRLDLEYSAVAWTEDGPVAGAGYFLKNVLPLELNLLRRLLT